MSQYVYKPAPLPEPPTYQPSALERFADWMIASAPTGRKIADVIAGVFVVLGLIAAIFAGNAAAWPVIGWSLLWLAACHPLIALAVLDAVLEALWQVVKVALVLWVASLALGWLFGDDDD